MSGFRPTNASKLRQSFSADSHEEGISDTITPSRRSGLPIRKDTTAKDDENEDSGPSINRSVLRGSTAGMNRTQASVDTSPTTNKRQRVSSTGDYVTTGTNGHVAQKSSPYSLIVKLQYRQDPSFLNSAPSYEDSEMYVTGQGNYGQLAIQMRKTHKGVPVRVDAFDPFDGISIVQMACGPTHCAALTSDGSIVTWGSNALGALGRDTGRPSLKGNWKYTLDQTYEMDESAPPNTATKDPQVDIESIPGEVDMSSFLDGVCIVKVAVGCHKTFALTSDGYVYAWGAFVVSVLCP
jgi:regulator of chromosome condensation